MKSNLCEDVVFSLKSVVVNTRTMIKSIYIRIEISKPLFHLIYNLPQKHKLYSFYK